MCLRGIPGRIFLAGIICILIIFQANAQYQPDRISFNEVLRILEEQYRISFTYADENVSQLTITPPTSDLLLDDLLQYLHKSTSLIFRQLDDRFITISAPDQEPARICGYISDMQSGEKLAGASIHAGEITAVSNELGYFVLHSVSPDENIDIQYLGYQNQIIPVHMFSSEQCNTVFLRPEIIRLPEISITNYLITGINKRTDGSLEIDTETLGIMPGLIEPDVLQSVQSLPGIQSANELVSDINIRGGTNDQNLILWDGIKMYMSSHFFGLISAFNPYLTQNVSLIKNGTSAYYGDGVSGTIDMRTESDLSQFSVGAGINMINADVFAIIPIGRKMSLQFSARRSMTDMFNTPTIKKYWERTFRDTDVNTGKSPADSVVVTGENFNFRDFSLNLRYQVSQNDEIRLNFLHIRNDLNYLKKSKYDSLAESRTNNLQQQSTGIGLFYRRTWSRKVRSTAFIYVSSYGLKSRNQNIFYSQRQIQENEVLDIGIKLETDIQFNNQVSFRTGYHFAGVGIGNLENNNNPLYLQYIRDVVRNHSIYGEAFWKSMTGSTNFRSGLRLIYLPELSSLIPEPRIVFNQKISRSLTLEVLGEMKSQYTTQVTEFQNDFFGIEKRRWKVSNNQDIPVIRSRQVSLGGHFQKKALLISVEGYYKKVTNIFSSGQGFQNQFQYIRTAGNYKVTGMDILLSWQFRNFYSWFSYSLARNIYDFKSLHPTEFPSNLDIRHTISTGGSYETKKFRISAGLNWHSGIPFTEPVYEEPLIDKEINYMEPNTSRLDNYLRLDISAIYLINTFQGKARIEIGASCWNLLDRENVINIYYTVDNQGVVKPIERYSLGFTPNFMLRFMF